MTITTIRPGSDTYVGSVTFTGAATGWQSTNDNSDATYISAASGASWPKALVRMKPVSGGVALGASSRILRVRLNARIRMSSAASGGASGTIRLAERSPDGYYDYWEQHQYADAVTYTTRFGTWRAKPPRGYGDEWTLAALESSSAEIQFQPPSSSAPNLRLAELYWDVDVRDRATVTAISITNPLTSTQPLVSWQYNANFDGDPQVAYRVKVFSSQQYTAWGFNPDTAQSVWDSGVVYSNATQVTVGKKLENGQTYAAWVMAAADFGGQKWWSAWNNSPPATIILTPLPPPTMIGSTTDQAGLRNLIRVQGNWNHLQVQDADFNNAFLGTGTWAAFFGGATIARVTSPVAEGAGAMQATKNGTPGDLDLLTAGATGGFKVKAGQVYTALASVRSAATPRTAKVGIVWSDRNGNSLSIDLSTGVTTSTSSWIQDSYTGTAPAGAVYGAAWVKFVSSAASEVHYVDKVAVATNVILGSGTISGTSGTSKPEVAAIYRSGYWGSPSKTFTCKAVPPASLLVAMTLSGRSASVTNNTVTSTGGLTWTVRRENVTASTGDASVSTAYFAAGGDIDVTVTGNAGDAITLVYAVTGHDEATYGGAHNLATSTSGAPAVSLTTGRENSLVIVGVGDFNEINGNLTRVWRKPGQTFVEDWYGDFGEGVTYAAHYWMPTAGSATHGLTAPTGQAYGAVAIEIRGASFNTTQTVYTGWTKGGWVGTGSTVVEKAMVATGRRNNAHPQLWSGGDWYKSTDGFYLPSGTENISRLVYDVEQNFQGQGSIRWDVNNAGSKLYMGWEDGPRWLGEPPYAMLGIEGRVYTFSLYARSDSTFSSNLVLQALDQFGGPVGSASQTGAISIGTTWTQYTVNLVMPLGCLWVRAHLENSGSAVERKVWVDGIQWNEGGTADVIPAKGEGASVDWEPIRYADQDEWFITDGETGLIGTIQDTEAPPGYGVVYRAYNYLAATSTVPALASPITFYATNRLSPPGPGVWYLRDPQDAALSVRIRVIGLDEQMHEESATFYPLRQGGEPQRAVTVTDYIGGEDGSIKAIVDSEAEWAIVKELLKKSRPMYLIFPDHGARYVRLTDRSWSRTTNKTRTSWNDPDPFRRELSLTFLESDAP